MWVKVECGSCGASLGSWEAEAFIRSGELVIRDSGVLEEVLEGKSRDPDEMYLRCPVCGFCEDVAEFVAEERDGTF